jgi:hypothetical protein
MANGYKAPSGLSSAVRGRSMVQRDYTSGVKFKATEREANRAALQSTLGIVQGIASGAAELSKAVETNILSHERAEEGARRIFESSPEFESGMTFEQSGFKGASLWDRWTKSAGEFSETQVLGGKEFSTANLINLGGLDSVAATRTGTAIKDESGNITGRKSLYESYGAEKNKVGFAEVMYDELVVLGGKGDESDGTTVIENNNQKQKKENAVTPKNNKKVSTSSSSQVDNKNNNKFAFTYKGEEVDFSDFFSNLFGKKPEQTESSIVAERLKRMKEGSLSTSPTNSE